MKYFLIITLLIGFCCNAQEVGDEKLIKYETDGFVISYPDGLLLEEYKSGSFIFRPFIIERCDDKEYHDPLVFLEIVDCTPFGAGPFPILKAKKEGKIITKGKTVSNIEYEEMSYDEDFGIRVTEYIFLKDAVIYSLKGWLKTGDTEAVKSEMVYIMKSFDLK